MGSIVDDPTPKQDESATPVNAEQLADMLYLVFEAVKDLEASFVELRKELTDESRP
jgi:hypothetical protein